MPQDRLAKKRYNISLKVILSVFEFSSEMLLRRSAVRSAESAPGLTICKVGLVYNKLLKLILELFNIRGGTRLFCSNGSVRLPPKKVWFSARFCFFQQGKQFHHIAS